MKKKSCKKNLIITFSINNIKIMIILLTKMITIK